MISRSAEEKDITWEDVFAFLSQKKSTINQNKPLSKVSEEDIDFLIEKLQWFYKRDQFLSLINKSTPYEVLTAPPHKKPVTSHSRSKSDSVYP